MFLIVDNNDSMCVNHLSEILGERGLPFLVQDRRASLDSVGSQPLSGIFLSGGNGIDMSQPVATDEIRLDLACLSKGATPIFGICMGFEIIVAECGGLLHTLDTPVPEDPVEIRLLQQDWIFTGLPEQVGMLEFNQLGAMEVPSFLNVTASSARSPIEAVQHQTRPVVATQFHPEATDQQGKHIPQGLEIVNNFIDFCLSVPSRWW